MNNVYVHKEYIRYYIYFFPMYELPKIPYSVYQV